jgi:PST family polysaccharide transporter
VFPSLTRDNLTDRTARATQWRFASAIVGALSQLAIGVLLARLLPPADFGLVTLALVVIGFVRPLGDFGVGNALVQRLTVTDRHVRAAFTFSMALGVALALLLVIAAPAGAILLRQPEVTRIVRVLAAGLAVGAAGGVAGALLRRQLDFKRLFFIDTSSYIIGYGGLAVLLALSGYGVWSLVWGSLLQTVIGAAAQFLMVRHSIRPLVGGRELRELLGFGLGATANSSVNYVALNADNFIVGRLIGPAGLGLYARAYSLMNLPFTYVAGVLSGALFPAFAHVQAERERLRRGYLLATALTAVVAAPAMGTMAIVAPHLVVTLYGPQWAGVVTPLRILCLAGYFRALYHLDGVVIQSVGWVYRELFRQAIYAVLVIVGALVGSRYGLGGVAAGVSVAIFYMFVALGRLALRATSTRWTRYLSIQRAALITTAITSGVALVVRLTFEALQMSSTVTTFAVLAAAAVPWSAGVLWTLAGADFSALRHRLPGWCVSLIEALPRPQGGDLDTKMQQL